MSKKKRSWKALTAEERAAKRRAKRRYARAKAKQNTRARLGPTMKAAPVKVTKADGSEEVVSQKTLRKRSRKKEERSDPEREPWRHSARIEKLARFSGYKTYADYLRSKVWRDKRREVLQRDGWRCGGCKSKEKLHVHHISYPHNLGQEPLDSLETLCETCHGREHRRRY